MFKFTRDMPHSVSSVSASLLCQYFQSCFSCCLTLSSQQVCVQQLSCINSHLSGGYDTVVAAVDQSTPPCLLKWHLYRTQLFIPHMLCCQASSLAGGGRGGWWACKAQGRDPRSTTVWLVTSVNVDKNMFEVTVDLFCIKPDHDLSLTWTGGFQTKTVWLNNVGK